MKIKYYVHTKMVFQEPGISTMYGTPVNTNERHNKLKES